MADGIIARMFPEWDSTVEHYGLDKAAKAIGRGIQTAPSGLLDLASLPFTMTGVVEPENVPGSSAWMDKKGFLIPKQTSDSAAGQFTLDSLELAGGMGLPSALGGAISRPAKEGVEALKSMGKGVQPPGGIPADRGQITNNLKLMTDAAKLSHDPKFAERVADFRRSQDNSAKNIIDGFKRSIGKADSKTDLGKRLQKNFGDWFDGVKKTYETRNNENFDLALKNPIAKNTRIPESLTGQDRINKFVQDELAVGGDADWKAALMDLQEKGMADMTGEMTLQGMAQKLRAANQAFSTNTFKQGPYDRVSPSNLDRINRVYKLALKDRLDDTIAMGGQEGGVAADLKKANHVFEVTTENLKNYQKQSINKFLGAKEDEVLNTEGIVDRFQKLSPTERQFFSAVANKVDPEMVGTMRRKIFDDLVAGGARVGRSSGETEFDIGGFLTKVDNLKTKNPEMYDWVIGNDPKIKQQFESIIDESRTAINNGTRVADETPAAGDVARRVGSAVFGVVSGKIGAARAADTGFTWIQSLATDKEALFKHIFEGGPPPPSAGQVIADKTKKGLFKVINETPDTGTTSGIRTGSRVGAAAEIAKEVQSDPSLSAPMGLESPETALQAPEMQPDDADLTWGAETPVEAPMASDTSVPDEELSW